MTYVVDFGDSTQILESRDFERGRARNERSPIATSDVRLGVMPPSNYPCQCWKIFRVLLGRCAESRNPRQSLCIGSVNPICRALDRWSNIDGLSSFGRGSFSSSLTPSPCGPSSMSARYQGNDLYPILLIHVRWLPKEWASGCENFVPFLFLLNTSTQ